jgi:hypothetical protein
MAFLTASPDKSGRNGYLCPCRIFISASGAEYFSDLQSFFSLKKTNYDIDYEHFGDQGNHRRHFR